jgi:drug/metabolite transporter (DMT)-like permease
MMAKKMGPAEWLLLIALSVLWGGSFLFVEIALDGVRPLTLVFGRVSVAAAVLVVYIHARGERLPADRRVWARLAVMGFLNNLLPFALIAWGQTHIDSGLASIINATTPLFTVLVAHAFTADERMTAGRLAGAALGLAGVVILIGPSALGGAGAGVAGELAVLAAAVSYAFAGVWGRRLGGLPSAVAAAGMLVCSSVMAAPLALAVDGLPQAVPAPAALAALAAIAVLSTALAYILYFRILAAAGATNLLLVTFLIPVTAILFGVVLLGEQLGLSALAGMAVIFGGLACVDGRALAWLRPTRAAG